MPFERLPSGEVIRSVGPDVHAAYHFLRGVHDRAVEESGALWNWPSALTLTAPSLNRILHLHDIYRRILDVPGVICEFGTHWGTSAAMLRNLWAIIEPGNRSRELHLFDTWEGFVGATESDGTGGEGDFRVTADWAKTLESALQALDAANQAVSAPRAVLHQGDARLTFETFLKEEPGKLVALAFLDMDIYGPTKRVLELLESCLVVGSVVVFDELNCPPYPGETIAFLESGLRWSRLTRSAFMPYSAFTVVESRR